VTGSLLLSLSIAGPTTKEQRVIDQREPIPPAPEVNVVGFRPLKPPSSPFVLALLAGIIVVGLLWVAGGGLFVLIIGAVLTVFLAPIVDRLERRGMGRAPATILVIVTAAVVTTVILVVVLVVLVEQGSHLARLWPVYQAQLQSGYATAEIPTQLRDAIDSVIDTLHDNASGVDKGTAILGVVQGILGFVGMVFAFFILPFFTFYLVKDRPRMVASLDAAIPGPWKKDVHTTLDHLRTDFAMYFKAELLVGAIMGIAVTIGMVVIGLVCGGGPLVTFAVLLGLIALVMEFLPQVGPVISYLPALALAAVTSPLAVVLVSVFYFIAFNIEGSILVPTFEGKMLDFGGATVIFLITMGFLLAGIVGAILALPVAMASRDIFRQYFRKAIADSATLAPAIRMPVPGTDRPLAAEGA
jgi:predicted PurR-regulated permease PerM